MKSYLPPPETDVEVERKTVPTSTLFPVARIGGADVGDDDHQHHGHHGDDPLGWLREAIPGYYQFFSFKFSSTLVARILDQVLSRLIHQHFNSH